MRKLSLQLLLAAQPSCYDLCGGSGVCPGFCGAGHSCCRTYFPAAGCPEVSCNGYHCCVPEAASPDPPPSPPRSPSPLGPPPPISPFTCGCQWTKKWHCPGEKSSGPVASPRGWEDPCYAFCCNRPPPPSPPPLPPAPRDCWAGCGSVAGPCHGFCGGGMACCRPGFPALGCPGAESLSGPCDGWCGQGHACCRTGVFTLGCPATACDGYHCCVPAYGEGDGRVNVFGIQCGHAHVASYSLHPTSSPNSSAAVELRAEVTGVMVECVCEWTAEYYYPGTENLLAYESGTVQVSSTGAGLSATLGFGGENSTGDGLWGLDVVPVLEECSGAFPISLDKFTTRSTNVVAGVASFAFGGDALADGIVGRLTLAMDEGFCAYLMPKVYATTAEEVGPLLGQLNGLLGSTAQGTVDSVFGSTNAGVHSAAAATGSYLSKNDTALASGVDAAHDLLAAQAEQHEAELAAAQQMLAQQAKAHEDEIAAAASCGFCGSGHACCRTDSPWTAGCPAQSCVGYHCCVDAHCGVGRACCKTGWHALGCPDAITPACEGYHCCVDAGPCDGWCGQGHACCRTGVFTLGCPATACDGYHCCVPALWAAGLQCADTLDLCGQACSACCRSADDPASLAPMQRAAQRLVAEGDAAAREPQGLIGARALLLGAAAAAVLSAAVLRRRAANARAAPSPDLPTRRRRREVRHPLF
ncbi:hypothetical protein EMIHUDRAFT_456159 [Emiliania huxleyi CCMP1516]|uniref:Uncharacterized protein n=2 Tax=Emiliania huxleyi TaxID=2903 RepID=A0A0D3K859_EMIH1|nr:hypothetical protein EMIHUDRAFT_456159 [Emiliania huxleyi CCMP1516]EOD31944.1 hypothetical protein EMIHUDRAFT_456159 [Emiliania huxleyi CCMP1516]|eukprot:XP_005784373.1 hypothetical protein EMIHUDRAFT_456159 [Emiliania huxleyi CCMP1516]